MKLSEEVLLKLIRIALGSEEPLSLPSVVNWREVVDLSYQQGVAALSVDGLQKIYDSSVFKLDLDNSELEDVKYEWFGQCMSSETNYKQYESVIGEFLTFCKSQEVKVMLLKGYGLSLFYPIPSHRPCGDIDIYLFGHAEFVNQLTELRLKVKVNRENSHHSIFQYKGYTFENHITLMDVNRHKNHVYDENLFNTLIAEGCDEIEVGGHLCYVPSVKLNSVYLLRHIAHHFAVEKITLRHLLDWALFVRANTVDIDWEFVWSYARKTGCAKFLSCLNSICVYSLGFNSTIFPVKDCNERLRSRMLSDILCTEFEAEIPPMGNFINYAMMKTRRILANRWKYRMVSNEPIFVTIIHLSLYRITHFKG